MDFEIESGVMTVKEESKLATSSLVLMALVTVPLFFLTFTADNFNLPKLALIAPLAVCSIVHLVISYGVEWIRMPVNLIVITLMIVILVAAFLSDTTIGRATLGYPGRANGLIYYLSLFTLLIVAKNCTFRQDFAVKLLRALQILFLVFLIYAFVQFSGKDPVPWTNPYNPIIGTLGNPNFAASFLAVGSFVFFTLAITHKNLLLFFSLGVSSLSLFLAWKTESIQGPILLLIGLGLMTFSFIYQASRRLAILIGSVAVTVLSILLFSFLGRGPLGASLEQYTLKLRLTYWSIGIESALNNPIFGLGPDSYIEGFRLFRDISFVNEYSSDLQADSAHNVFINFAANFGIIAFLLLLTLVLLISKRAWGILLRTKEYHFLVGLLSFMWFLFLIQSLISIEQIGLGVTQWIVGGLLLNEEFLGIGLSNSVKASRVRVPSRSHLYEFRGEVALLSLLLVSVISLKALREDATLGEIRTMTSLSGVSKEDADAKIAKVGILSKWEWQRSIHLYNLLVVTGRVEEAEEFLEDLIVKDPQSRDAIDQLARMKRFSEDYNAEIALRRKIMAIDPNNPSNLLRLAEAYELIGNTKSAEAIASTIKESFSISPWNESATAFLEKLSNR